MRIAATCVKTVGTFERITATFARTAETFGVIDEISGRMFDQGRAPDRSDRIGGTFAKTDGISGKIIVISGMIVKTGVGIGETYGTAWVAIEATAVKHSDMDERSRQKLRSLPAFLCREIFDATGTIRHIRPSSISITSAQVETGGRAATGTPRFVAISCSRP